MIGSLVYILLDVSFNVLVWSGKKTVDGVVYVSSYAYNNLNKQENILEIEANPPHYNDVRKEIEEEEKKEEEERINKENIIKMNEIKLLIEENEITMNKLKKIIS